MPRRYAFDVYELAKLELCRSVTLMKRHRQFTEGRN